MAVMVRVEEPAGVDIPAFTVRVDGPEPPMTTCGVKLVLTPAGNPFTLSATSPLKPSSAPIASV
jgi:hypothetical protein